MENYIHYIKQGRVIGMWLCDNRKKNATLFTKTGTLKICFGSHLSAYCIRSICIDNIISSQQLWKGKICWQKSGVHILETLIVLIHCMYCPWPACFWFSYNLPFFHWYPKPGRCTESERFGTFSNPKSCIALRWILLCNVLDILGTKKATCLSTQAFFENG